MPGHLRLRHLQHGVAQQPPGRGALGLRPARGGQPGPGPAARPCGPSGGRRARIRHARHRPCRAPDTPGPLAKVLSMAHSPAVTKAVIPVAGLGTRFLPATKATPKEMLPVVDTPDHPLCGGRGRDRAASATCCWSQAGARTPSRTISTPTRSWSRPWRPRATTAGLAAVRKSSGLAAMHFVRQGAPRGLGHAVLCAAEHVGNEPFAVLLGDDFIHPHDLLLQRMIAVQEQVRRQRGGPDGGRARAGVFLRGGRPSSRPTRTTSWPVTDLVEKPARPMLRRTGS